jgi:hypothetical protein
MQGSHSIELTGTENSLGVTRGWRRGVGVYWVEFEFGKMKKFHGWMVGMLQSQQCECA